MLRIFVIIISASIILSCTSHDVEPVNCDLSNLSLVLGDITPASDCSASDGKILLVAAGGKKPYQFSLNGQTSQPDSMFSDLRSGIYSIAVRDKNGCEVFLNNITVLSNGFEFDATVQNDSECLAHNGSVLIEVAGNAGPYTYRLSNGEFSSTNLFTGLAWGQHVILVKDTDACTIELNVTVPRDKTNTSWSNDILPIINLSCALTGCHDGKSRVDYRIYTNAQKDAIAIKTNTQNRSMPFDGTPLSQNQIDLITCWVEDGALEN